MYNQCIYFTPKKHQTNIYYMKHTKIYQARIQRTRQIIIPVQKIIRNPAALIKDSILCIKTTTKIHKIWNSTNIDDITFCGLTQQQNTLKLKINEYR